MATVHLNGTRLAPKAPRVPLNRPLMIALTIMFVCATHLFLPNLGGEGLLLPFNAATWLVFSVAAAIGLYQLSRHHELRYSKLTLGLLVSCLLLTVPLFYPDSPYHDAPNRLLGLWAGYGFFVLLQQFKLSNKHKLRLLWLVVVAVTLEALLGYAQYFAWLPTDINAPLNHFAPDGVFQHPSVMASFLATGLVLSAYLLTRQPIKYHQQLSATSLLYTMPVITVPLLLVLGSLAGWLGAMIACILILPYLYRYAIRQRFVGWLLALMLGVLLGLFMKFQQPLTSESSTPATYSYQQRFTIARQTLDMVIEKPFTGYGYGRFETQYLLYTARQHQLNHSYPAGIPALTHPQNELLLWMIEGGALPLIGILFAALLVLFRIHTAKAGTRLAMFALFVPIVLHTQVGSPFALSAIHWITFVILLFWVDQRVARYKAISFGKWYKRLFKISGSAVWGLTSLYTLSALHCNTVLTTFEHSTEPDTASLTPLLAPQRWVEKLDQSRYAHDLALGIKHQNPHLITPYIAWAQRTLRHTPRPEIYRDLIMAYQAIQDDQRANQTRDEARYLFPHDTFSPSP